MATGQGGGWGRLHKTLAGIEENSKESSVSIAPSAIKIGSRAPSTASLRKSLGDDLPGNLKPTADPSSNLSALVTDLISRQKKNERRASVLSERRRSSDASEKWKLAGKK